MPAMAISAGFRQELVARKFDAILLSGGGNDLFDAIAQGYILKPAEPGADAATCPGLASRIASITGPSASTSETASCARNGAAVKPGS